MASQSLWYYTGLPNKVIDTIEEDLEYNFDGQLRESIVGHNPNGDESDRNFLDKQIRNAKNAWIPTTHWVGGFCWHYVTRANRENFCYDLEHIDQESLQYTVYGDGEYYGWHTDADLDTFYTPMSNFGGNKQTEDSHRDYLMKNGEKVRKLSFSLIVSDPDTYQGGNFEIKGNNGKVYLAPRQRGTIILFDSRALHRVTKVTGGIRKSIVGWTVGPRWK
tara:strand:+ start:155 stop:811 length:657 start_codon:yes stop_codon:yes gene_type:complete